MSSQSRLDFDAPAAPRTAALRSFHARSHLTTHEALSGEKAAKRQEAQILAWFHARALRGHRRFTPSAVAAAFTEWPLTSIRRALTNLTTAGALVHYPADRRPGPYGRNESTWGLPE